MSKVFVLDRLKQPLNPIHPARARMLLSQGKAAVFRHYPFTIIVKSEISNPKVEPLRVKIDPGAKTTGLALVNDSTDKVVWVGQLQHRGFQIREALTSRRQLRRSRRNRKTWYRQPRFLISTPDGLIQGISISIANTFTKSMATLRHSLAGSGVLNPAQKPSFPPAVKSLATHLWFDMSPSAITGASTRKER